MVFESGLVLCCWIHPIILHNIQLALLNNKFIVAILSVISEVIFVEILEGHAHQEVAADLVIWH